MMVCADEIRRNKTCLPSACSSVFSDKPPPPLGQIVSSNLSKSPRRDPAPQPVTDKNVRVQIERQAVSSPEGCPDPVHPWSDPGRIAAASRPRSDTHKQQSAARGAVRQSLERLSIIPLIVRACTCKSCSGCILPTSCTRGLQGCRQSLCYAFGLLPLRSAPSLW